MHYTVMRCVIHDIHIAPILCANESQRSSIDLSGLYSCVVLSAKGDVLLNRRDVLVPQSVNCFNGRLGCLRCKAFEEICVVLVLVF